MRKSYIRNKLYGIADEIMEEINKQSDNTAALCKECEESGSVSKCIEFERNLGRYEGLIECEKKIISLIEELGLN